MTNYSASIFRKITVLEGADFWGGGIGDTLILFIQLSIKIYFWLEVSTFIEDLKKPHKYSNWCIIICTVGRCEPINENGKITNLKKNKKT